MAAKLDALTADAANKSSDAVAIRGTRRPLPDCRRDGDGLKAWHRLQESPPLRIQRVTVMRAVVQRVSRAKVTVAGEVSGEIGIGLLILLGVADDDASPDAEFLADKLVGLRIFSDDEGKMNRSLADIAGAMLVVSQFTSKPPAQRPPSDCTTCSWLRCVVVGSPLPRVGFKSTWMWNW
jgi:hypothetical protein